MTRRIMQLFCLGCVIFSLGGILYSFIVGFNDWIDVYRPTYGAVAVSVAWTAIFGFLSLRGAAKVWKRIFVVLSFGFGVLSVTGLLLHFRWDQVGLVVVIAFAAWVVILTAMVVTGVLSLSGSGKREA